MVGLNKFTEKERRKQRRSFQSNHIAHDLHSPKYHQRVVPAKKADRFYEEEIEYHNMDDNDDE